MRPRIGAGQNPFIIDCSSHPAAARACVSGWAGVICCACRPLWRLYAPVCGACERVCVLHESRYKRFSMPHRTCTCTRPWPDKAEAEVPSPEGFSPSVLHPNVDCRWGGWLRIGNRRVRAGDCPAQLMGLMQGRWKKRKACAS